MHSLFASPGDMSDSWMIVGILQVFAANTTGTVTKPPLEKTTSGFSLLSILRDSPKPLSTLNGSVRFLTLLYLLSFPEEIPM